MLSEFIMFSLCPERFGAVPWIPFLPAFGYATPYTGWLVRECFLSSTTDTTLSRHDYSGNFVNLQLLLSYITASYLTVSGRAGRLRTCVRQAWAVDRQGPSAYSVSEQSQHQYQEVADVDQPALSYEFAATAATAPE